MSVYITFESQNESGVVAEGTLLLDAAKRLGVTALAECRGLEKCDTCAVIVRGGADLLSSPTEAEQRQLSEERLAAGERLVCQTKIVRSGELYLTSPPLTEPEETVEEAATKFREEFRALPLSHKIKRLAEFEAISAFEALTEFASLPFTVGEKVLDVIADFGRKRERGRQTDHKDQKSSDDERKDTPVDGT